METKKKSITFRLSDDGHAYLREISAAMGISKTAIVEVALRRMIRARGQRYIDAEPEESPNWTKVDSAPGDVVGVEGRIPEETKTVFSGIASSKPKWFASKEPGE